MTSADYFNKAKDNQWQALKMLGHPVSRVSANSRRSTAVSTTMRAPQSVANLTSQQR